MAAYAALVSLAQTTDLNTNKEEYIFSIKAKEKIRSIYEYVVFLLLFLHDFPEKVKRRWEGKMRDVASETEDIIKLFMLQQIQSSSMRMNPSSIKLEDQLENVTEKIGLIAGELMEERPADLPAAVSSPSILAPAANDTVVGLDDDLLSMKERLCGQSPHLTVIPIVGMGGIGKTTLARTVYHDALITQHFEIRAWVTVSQDYSPRRLSKMLLSLVDSLKLYEKEKVPRQKFDDSEIAVDVFRELKCRRYLIVIDDVWSTEVWDDVMCMFPDDYNGSRIVLTTRQLDVASYPNSDICNHEMQFLNDYQSWNLIKKKVFVDSNCPYALDDVGRKIARSCVGLPLAVVLVAGILSTVDKTPACWEEIAKNVNPFVKLELKEILSLSYNHLPHHLRPCFLLIGGFAEDANIHASRLVKLWVAEGFLKHQSECSNRLEEEEAHEYLEDLVKRNLVIVSSRKSNGRIKSCSLHDMVRDMCISKARDEKFLRVMDGSVVPPDVINERRISFRISDINNIWGPTIRTILCFQVKSFSSWLTFLRGSKLVRVLDAEGDNPKELPSQVFDLFYLRYLALSGTFKIPSNVSNLVNLQTLIIHPTLLGWKRYWRGDQNAPTFYLPLEIWTMPQLRHLVLYHLYVLPHPPDGSDLPLQNLQTLWYVKDLVWNEKILQMIPNVKRLGLVYTSMNEDYHLHLLKYLDQLEKLEVNGCWDFSWRRQNPVFPNTLRKLSLVGGGTGGFPWKDMGIIGSLPNLQVLKLLHCGCDGAKWETTDEEFPKLQYLLIDGSDPGEWITEDSPFPSLKHLVLRFCWYLTEIPEAIAYISTLEVIQVVKCRKSLVESAKQIKEDQQDNGNDAFQVRFDYSSLN